MSRGSRAKQLAPLRNTGVRVYGMKPEPRNKNLNREISSMCPPDFIEAL